MSRLITAKKIVYLSHPLEPAYEDENNYSSGAKTVYELSQLYPGFLFLSPAPLKYIYQDEQSLWMLNQRKQMLLLADEIWVIGENSESANSQMDIAYAHDHGIPWIHVDSFSTELPPTSEASMEPAHKVETVREDIVIDNPDFDIESVVDDDEPEEMYFSSPLSVELKDILSFQYEQEVEDIQDVKTSQAPPTPPSVSTTAAPLAILPISDPNESGPPTDIVRDPCDDNFQDMQSSSRRSPQYQPITFTSMEYRTFMQSKDWQSARALVMKRANGICEACLTRPATEVHHETYEYGLLPPLYMLKAVCKQCHVDIFKLSKYGQSAYSEKLSDLPWCSENGHKKPICTSFDKILSDPKPIPKEAFSPYMYTFEELSHKLGTKVHELIRWLVKEKYLQYAQHCKHNVTPTSTGMKLNLFSVRNVQGNSKTKTMPLTEFTQKGLEFLIAQYKAT